VAGAVAGFTATAPMTAVMAAAHQSLPRDERGGSLPPRQVTVRAADRVGLADDLDEPEKDALTTVAHFGFGAAAGAVYGLLVPRRPSSPVLSGVAFGLGVWAVSYLAALPALRLFRPPESQTAGQVGMLIAAHVAWGAALGVLTEETRGSD
jgi:hypothetical protein